MYIHGEKAGGEQDAQHGAGHQDGVDRDVDLRVLDQAQRAVLGRVPDKGNIGQRDNNYHH